MSISQLFYLFILTVLLTFTFALIFRNRGPWNNPMLFFLMLFMTSWSIILWLGPVTIRDQSYYYASATALAIIIAIFLAATKIIRLEKVKIRRVKDKKLLEVVTKSDFVQERIVPNTFFWVLIALESFLIIGAYIVKSNILLE